jgi:hypothetical protein
MAGFNQYSKDIAMAAAIKLRHKHMARIRVRIDNRMRRLEGGIAISWG